MPNTMVEREELPWFRRLYLPAYRISDVARYTGMQLQTVASWYYRGDVPVLSGHETGKPLTYFELVEVAFVAFFRRMGVSMRSIRAARGFVAQRFNVEFPLAEYQFKTEGMHILMEYNQFDPDPNLEKLVVADRYGQLAWTDLFEGKFAEFDYEFELALRWHPSGRASLVVIDPRLSFGAPTVSGLPTWVIKGRWNAGETQAEIVEEFRISEKAVRDALHFEGLNGQSDIILG